MTRTDNGEVTPYQWETNDLDYDPSLHYANFLVAGARLRSRRPRPPRN